MFGRYQSIDKAADAELVTRVSIALILLNRPALRDVQPAALNGRVTLRGTLPSTADCLLAVEAIRRVAGVRQVIDRLRIRSNREEAQKEKKTVVVATPIARLPLARLAEAAVAG